MRSPFQRAGAASSTERSWAARPGIARVIRAGVVLVPLCCGMLAAVATSAVLPPGGGVLGFIARTAAVVVASTVVVWAVDRIARRALPLAALMQLSLVFPDQAPSRFKAALRSGSSRRLERQVAQTRSNGLPSDPGQAALAVVEMIGAIGDHDRRTRGHSERVRLYADLIGEELKLSPEERQKLQWGALLHDLGKLMVPEEILNKPGKPTPEEWAILQQHPAQGEALIEPLRPFLGMWADAIGGHHEKWDGSGYPRGLVGSKIPPSAAIVAVADSFEVMTAVRSYKAAMPLSEARAELTRCAGTHFDPEVVRAMLSVSLGRLRIAMGPLASLAHVPFVDGVVRLPSVLGAGGTSAANVAASVVPSVASGVAAATLAVGLVAPTASPTITVDAASSASAATPPGAAAGGGSLGAPVATPDQASDGTGAAPAGDAAVSAEPVPAVGNEASVDAPTTTVLAQPNRSVEASTTVAPSTTRAPVSGSVPTAPPTTRPATVTTAAPTTAAPTTAAPTPSSSTPGSSTTSVPASTAILVSKNEWRTGATSLQGESFAAGSTIYVFIAGLTGSTQWWLADDDDGAPYATDGTTPFDLAGTNSNLSARPFVVPTTPGTYWITVRRSGSGSSTMSASFLVV